jgi:hypothetical protein
MVTPSTQRATKSPCRPSRRWRVTPRSEASEASARVRPQPGQTWRRVL